MLAKLLFSSLLLLETLGDVVYLKSSGTRSCGGVQAPCLTFEEVPDYLHNSGLATNMEFVFLAGTHQANSVRIELSDKGNTSFLAINKSVVTIIYRYLYLNLSGSQVILKSINFQSACNNSILNNGSWLRYPEFSIIVNATIVRITSCSFISSPVIPSTLSVEANSTFLTNCLFSVEGGIKINNHGYTLLTSSTFKNSKASTGGALYVRGSGTEDTEIKKCSFLHNTAEYGGVLFIENTNVRIENSVFANNIATENGGVVYLKQGRYTSVHTLYSNNTAKFGGTIFIETGQLRVFTSTFQKNSAVSGGGSIFIKMGHISCTFCSFRKNFAPYGGAVYLEEVNSNVRFEMSSFIANEASVGGVFHVKQGFVHLVESNYTNNKATSSGGVTYIENGHLKVNRCHFKKQTARNFGGVFYAKAKSINITASTFQSNHADQGAVFYSPGGSVFLASNSVFQQNWASYGAVGYLSASLLTVIDCSFVRNHADYGAVLYLNKSSAMAENCIYKLNYANKSGGVYYVVSGNVNSSLSSFVENSAEFGTIVYTQNPISNVRFRTCNFCSNKASKSGGVVFLFNAHMIDISYSNFSSNKANREGGALACGTGSDAIVLLFNCRFDNNYAPKGGAIYTENTEITVQRVDFVSNMADSGGAMYVSRQSKLFFYEEASFINNTALVSGGAMFFSSSTCTIAGEGSSLSFYNNTATNGTGGAIFYRDDSYTFVCYSSDTSGQACLLNFKDHIHFFNHKFYSKDNTARLGSFMYGGLLYRCKFHINGSTLDSLSAIKMITQNSASTNASAISSDAVRVCHCVAMQPDCSYKVLLVSAWRGEIFNVSLAVLDQNSNMVSSFVTSGLDDTSKGEIRNYEYTQSVKNYCTDVAFHVSTEANEEKLFIYANGPCKDADENLKVLTSIKLLQGCPTGFEGIRKCDCDKRLLKFKTICNIDNQTVEIDDFKFWIRFNNRTLIYSSCPFNYCRKGRVTIELHESSDQQCSAKRSGVLCGACSKKFSRELGSGACAKCTDTKAYIWLIFVFIMAGILLALLLTACRLTVSIGTLNGLVFFANVISINKSDYFGQQNVSLFSIFIDWINLDFGIRTCFYDGLDSYEWMWLQYVFPIYIWSLVVVIIIAAQKSAGIMKVLGRNLISLLTTLILLSYTKLIKTITVSLSATTLYRSPNSNADNLEKLLIWKLDGNVSYLHGKHVPLFVAAILTFLAFFLPYTTLLLFGQCIRMAPRRRGLLWTHSSTIIAVLDSYHAPYKKAHRYWTGMALLFRYILVLTSVYQTDYFEKHKVNIITTLLIVLAMLIFKWIVGSIYRNKFVNKLEDFFLFNLLLLTCLTYFLHNSTAKEVATSVCIGMAMVAFAIILIYHSHMQFSQKFRQIFTQVCNRKSVSKANNDANSNTIGNVSAAKETNVPQTFITLREPLLTSV